MMNIYKCGDGKWFASGMFVSEMFWGEFCEVMGIPELEHDPRFATAAQRAENRRELIAILDRRFASQPREEWERLFRARGMWCSVLNRIADLPADPQVQANEYITRLDNGLNAVALPFELEGVELPRRGAPEHGQHTDEILNEVCGYSWEDIVELKAAEIVW
jgi:crotonobetainyl-CoA:carnitine CoA-transferase CaiB-like acyl-CoA transferase